MATTRLMPVHMNQGKTMLQSISDRTEYVKNPDKTDGGLLVSAYECDPASVEVEFLLAKEQYRQFTGREPKKGKDVIAYHLRQSFYPGEITPEEANRMGYELAREFTGGRHQFLVATHIDKAHVHNHVIINSTTLDCTHKFNNYKDSANAIRDISDRLCLEKGYSVITEPEEKGKDYAEWYAEKNGTSWKEKLKKTIGELLPDCRDFEDFLRQMQEKGYEVKRGKYISLRAPGQKRFTRLKTLGSEFTEEALRAKLDKRRDSRSTKSVAKGGRKFRGSYDRDVAVLIDIEKKLAKGKGAGYEYWAKRFNLTQMAKALCAFREEGMNSMEELEVKVEAAVSDFNAAADCLKETEREIRELKKMKNHILDYGRTREVYAEFVKRGKPEDFLETHREEIQIHLAAKKAFDEYKPKKVPGLKTVNARLTELYDRQKLQYEHYRQCRENMQKWQAVQQNLASALKNAEKEKHRGVSR